jgi:hypothetical protein
MMEESGAGWVKQCLAKEPVAALAALQIDGNSRKS